MKHNTITILSAGLLLTSGVLPANPTVGSHLERGVELMQDDATVQDAILHFEKVLQKQEESRKLAAEACYLLAQCQLKLGQTEQARATVDRLATGWPAGNKWVTKAATLIPSPTIFREAPWSDRELSIYHIGATEELEGEMVGHWYTAQGLVAGERNGVKTWTAMGFSAGPNAEYSSIEFDGRDFRPLRGRTANPLAGDLLIEQRDGGGFTLRHPEDKKPFLESPLTPDGDFPVAFYEHNQVWELVRLLPDELGSQTTVPMTTFEEGCPPKPVSFTAAKHESITVPAGTFDCVLYTTDRGESIWVQRAGARRVVRLKHDPLDFTLARIDDDWNPGELMPWKAGDQAPDYNPDVPEGFIKMIHPGEGVMGEETKGNGIAIFDTKLRVFDGVVERTTGEGGTMPEEERKKLLSMVGSKNLTDEVFPFGPRLIEHATLRGLQASERRDRRQVINIDGSPGLVATLKLTKHNQRFERTALFVFEEDGIIMSCLAHPAGADDQALAFLKEITKNH